MLEDQILCHVIYISIKKNFQLLIGTTVRKTNKSINSWNRNPSPGASRVALVVKNLPANAGDLREAGLIPELGRSPGGGHGNPLQYSCL